MTIPKYFVSQSRDKVEFSRNPDTYMIAMLSDNGGSVLLPFAYVVQRRVTGFGFLGDLRRLMWRARRWWKYAGSSWASLVACFSPTEWRCLYIGKRTML